MFSSKSHHSLIPLALLLLSGCQSLKDWEGAYHGYQYSVTSGTTHTSEHIEVDVTVSGKTKLTLKINSSTEPRELTAEFPNTKEIIITDQAFLSAPARVTRPKKSEDCYSQLTDETHNTTLCFDRDTISLVYALGQDKYYRIVVSKRENIDLVPKLEEQKAFTSEELFERTLQQSFESKIEINRVIQAKKAAKLAWLNLTPHISMSDVGVIASGGGIGLVAAGGDLVPFLLPTRWYDAYAKGEYSQAEMDAFILLKSDTANGIATLSMAYQMDKEILQSISDIRDLNAEILGQVISRERLGLFLPGTSLGLQANLNNLDQLLITLKRGLIADRNALALGAGFYNPFAIDSMQFNFNADISAPAEVHYEDLLQEVYDHSYELKQLDHIVAAYRYSFKARKFNWLDPGGDPQGGIGLGLPVYIGIGKYQVKEWEERQEQLKAILLQKVSKTFNDRKMAIELYTKSAEGLEIQKKRIATLKAQMSTSTNFDPVGFLLALRDYADNLVQFVSAKYFFYVAQEQLDRARMSGHYEAIPFDTLSQTSKLK